MWFVSGAERTDALSVCDAVYAAIPNPSLVMNYVLARALLSVCLQQRCRTDTLLRRDLHIMSTSRGNLSMAC